ncbi:27 kDa hemolymph glycoprotein-like isoform X3 [Neodiprion fabricii]|uniref:27 kDa hemolymph glycoprotein-like isoform X3 n=1 Tax=Neodiprion fabricii TaxID=2872261 RepID=UPI001ED94C3D|nr:27 kDa hemolymph glycoprotein-like isoform X3 [Neodiprion fabricii]
MKILIAFGFFLVAGILNSGVAQAEEPKKPPAKQTYVELLGKVKVNPLSEDDSDEYDEELVKAKCNKNGGPTAYDTAVQGLANLQNTIESVINSTDNSIESDVSDDSSSEELISDDFAVICLSFVILKNWATQAMDAIKPCLDLEERQAIELLVNISSPVMEFICENDGSQLLGFFETGGIECIEAKSDSLNICLPGNSTSAESTESTEVATSSPGAVIPKPFDLPEFAVDLEDCSDFEAIQKCVVGQLNGCPQRTPSNFINSIFNIIKKESGCTAILKAHKALAANAL